MALKKLKLKKPPQAEAVVTETTKVKGETVLDKSTTEPVDTPTEVTPEASEFPWCEVGVEASYTMNLGDYNSTRLGVSLKMPSQVADLNKTFDYAKSWVEERLTSLVEEAKQ